MPGDEAVEVRGVQGARANRAAERVPARSSCRLAYLFFFLGGHVVRGNGGSALERQSRTRCVVDTPKRYQQLHTWGEARQQNGKDIQKGGGHTGMYRRYPASRHRRLALLIRGVESCNFHSPRPPPRLRSPPSPLSPPLYCCCCRFCCCRSSHRTAVSNVRNIMAVLGTTRSRWVPIPAYRPRRPSSIAIRRRLGNMA